MKKLCILLSAVSSLLFATQSHAFLGLSLGAHIGYQDFDNSNVDGGLVAGVNLGADLANFVLVGIALDAEIATSITDFESGGNDFEYDSKGLYLTAKTLGPLYAIGRYGFIDADFGDSSDDGSVLTYGVGFSVGAQTEITLANIDYDDAGDATQLSLRFGF